jgi:hypothetical protein
MRLCHSRSSASTTCPAAPGWRRRSDVEQRAVYVAWIRGVLTGHNYANPGQQVSVISSGTVEQHVDRHCREKPQGSFSDAALRLSDRLSGRNAPITK